MGRDPTTKLTAKRELFIQGIISGKSQRKAYIDAGYKTEGKTNEYIDTEACKLFKNPKVFQRYQNLIGESKEKALWSREIAFRELMELIHDSKEDRNYTGRLGAIKELNALDDLYPKEKKEIDLKVSSSDVFGKLKEAILNE